jgi:hypothetical protein
MKTNWIWRLLPLWLILAPLSPARAIDHNNVDGGRPLSFEDAEAVAYRELAVEAGLGAVSPFSRKPGLTFSAEALYGFALNTHLGLDVDTATGGRAASAEKGFEIEAVGVNVLHNFNREYGRVPAFSLRGDVSLPIEEGRDGLEIRLRGIASRALVQYDRLHLNLDGVLATSPEAGERRFRPGLILGYSKPLGYPRRFHTTGVAELAILTSERKGAGAVGSLGLGLRRQVTVRSVVDVGIRSDALASSRAPHDSLIVTAGYSIGF